MRDKCISEEKLRKVLEMKAEELLRNEEFLYGLRSTLEDWVNDIVFDEIASAAESVLDSIWDTIQETIQDKLYEALDKALEKVAKKTIETIDFKKLVREALEYLARNM